MINELKRYLQIVTGEKIDNIDTVAFSLLFTLNNITDTDCKDIVNVDNVDEIRKLIYVFRCRTSDEIKKIVNNIISQEA